MPDKDVTHLAQVTLPPNEDVVCELRKALTLAESGQLRAVALAGVMHDQRSYTMYYGDGNTLYLVGVMRLMEHELLDVHALKDR